MRQILLAVEFCHLKQIAHRGITVDNVMLAWRDGAPLVKIIDFSQAMIFGCSNPRSIPENKRMVAFIIIIGWVYITGVCSWAEIGCI